MQILVANVDIKMNEERSQSKATIKRQQDDIHFVKSCAEFSLRFRPYK